MPEESKPQDKLKIVRGQNLYLMPEKTIFWQETKTLMAADLHIGKDSAFRKAGIAVPEAVTNHDLKKLFQAIKRTDAKRLILLGDFQHSKSGNTIRTIDKVAEWRNELENVEIVLIPGNHDLASGQIPEKWRFTAVREAFKEGPFTFKHYPEPERDTFTFSGHLHPSVRLYGKGKQSEKLPCFYFKNNYAVLPAFGSFTGSFNIEPERNSQIFLVLEDTIVKYNI